MLRGTLSGLESAVSAPVVVCNSISRSLAGFWPGHPRQRSPPAGRTCCAGPRADCCCTQPVSCQPESSISPSVAGVRAARLFRSKGQRVRPSDFRSMHRSGYAALPQTPDSEAAPDPLSVVGVTSPGCRPVARHSATAESFELQDSRPHPLPVSLPTVLRAPSMTA